MRCNICDNPLNDPVYESSEARAITSLCEVRPVRTRVYFCRSCTHLQTEELADLPAYYAKDYRLLTGSEEEDQLYDVQGDTWIYRSEHQARTLLAKVSLPPHAKVLDYGCGKGATMKQLMRLHPDITPHFFDVSDMYFPFWQKLTPMDNGAAFTLPASWAGTFDLVTAFFVLEHVSDPVAELCTIRSLLNENGLFYGVVPNVYANSGDLIVADHVNHYSEASLRYLLAATGFTVLEIDTNAHRSAFVVVARKSEEGRFYTDPQILRQLQDRVLEMSTFWRCLAARVRTFEEAHIGDGAAAIYGAGFYGTFITTSLAHFDRISCFLDRDPYRQGCEHLNRPILAPEELPKNVSMVYVGLNPMIAQSEIEKIHAWRDRALSFFYLSSSA